MSRLAGFLAHSSFLPSFLSFFPSSLSSPETKRSERKIKWNVSRSSRSTDAGKSAHIPLANTRWLCFSKYGHKAIKGRQTRLYRLLPPPTRGSLDLSERNRVKSVDDYSKRKTCPSHASVTVIGEETRVQKEREREKERESG